MSSGIKQITCSWFCHVFPEPTTTTTKFNLNEFKECYPSPKAWSAKGPRKIQVKKERKKQKSNNPMIQTIPDETGNFSKFFVWKKLHCFHWFPPECSSNVDFGATGLPMKQHKQRSLPCFPSFRGKSNYWFFRFMENKNTKPWNLISFKHTAFFLAAQFAYFHYHAKQV